MEMTAALDELGTGKITKVINQISDSSEIPTELSKSIFNAQETRCKMECELHRTISLMSHMMKIILNILTMRRRGLEAN